MFYKGMEMKGERHIGQYRYEQGDVIQAMIM